MTKKSRNRRVSLRAKQRQRRLITELFLSEYRQYPLTYDDVYITFENEEQEVELYEAHKEFNDYLKSNPIFANQETRR